MAFDNRKIVRCGLIRLAKMKLQIEALGDSSEHPLPRWADTRHTLRGLELCGLLGIAPENLDSALCSEECLQ